MNAQFFALAFVAALNPKLLALDLLLVENRRPRAMFLFVLIGGMTVAVAFGLAVALVAQPATSTQLPVIPGLDLARGAQAAAQEKAGLARHYRQAANGRHRPGPGCLPDDQWPGAPWLAPSDRLRNMAASSPTLKL